MCTNTNSTHPSENTSAALKLCEVLQMSPAMISGALYSGDPTASIGVQMSSSPILWRLLQDPKSQIFSLNWEFISKFSGFMSLWTMFLLCKYSTAGLRPALTIYQVSVQYSDCRFPKSLRFAQQGVKFSVFFNWHHKICSFVASAWLGLDLPAEVEIYDSLSVSVVSLSKPHQGSNLIVKNGKF